MKKTLIVDDDHLVRSYLKMLSAWERAGFQIEAEARDGEEALSLLGDLDADLLVTDVSMPLLDGIELIRRIRQGNQRVYIIVLSCHDEFAYVKDALKEGADDYVLKNTLNEDSLYQLLQEAAERMEKKAQQNARMEHLAKAGGDQLKYAFFSKAVGEELSPEELDRERRRAGVQGRYRKCGVVCMLLESWEARRNRPELRRYCQEFQRRLPELLEEGGERLRMEAVYWGEGLFYGFVDLSDVREGSAMGQKLSAAARACGKACGGEPVSFRVGVSGACMGRDALRTAFRQVNGLMEARFYVSREVLYYDAGKKMCASLPAEAEALLAQADTYRYQGDQERFLEACMAAGRSFERELVEGRLVRQWLQDLERKTGIPPEEGLPVSMEQVYRRLERDAQRLFPKPGNPIPEDVSRTVAIAAEYVRRHYKEPMGLQEAAAAAGVNPAYLSYRFRKEMGVGFSNFLLNQRIAHAMELLRRTSMKVREVAEQSGFQDYHYFAKAFKKVNGLSPAEYRKRTDHG